MERALRVLETNASSRLGAAISAAKLVLTCRRKPRWVGLAMKRCDIGSRAITGLQSPCAIEA